jgi:hypothetical protein
LNSAEGRFLHEEAVKTLTENSGTLQKKTLATDPARSENTEVWMRILSVEDEIKVA